MSEIRLSEVVGKGYNKFWSFRGRYLVCKGSRGSKKSVTACIRIIFLMMKYPLSNTLVIRQVFNTHKDSTWTELKKATHRLGVSHLWNFSKSPLEATYTPTGQKILFRGLDDSMSITSISVPVGFLNFCLWEEAYQVRTEEDFNKVDMSIRGELPKGYFKQHTIIFNPWSDKHWLKKRFFDVKKDDTLAITTNYLVNEFLGEDDIEVFNKMKQDNPTRYRIEGLGEWGVSEGLIFTNWEEQEINLDKLLNDKNVKFTYGLDFGYNDPNALICVGVDETNKILYLFDEFYQGGMTNDEIYQMLVDKKVHKYEIICDSANPKDIEDLRRKGARRVKGAKKGKDSIVNGIKTIQEYKIIVDPRCENMIIELSNYCWDNKDNKALEKPIDDFCHLIDALRYSIEYIGRNKIKVTSKKKLF